MLAVENGDSKEASTGGAEQGPCQAAGAGEISLDRHGWHVAAAVVVGASHVERDKPGGDAVAAGICDGWFVGVVSDGAGSVSHGEVGARLASSGIVEALLTTLAASNVSIPGSPGESPVEETAQSDSTLQSAIERVLEAVRASIVAVAGNAGVPDAAFASTVVGVACRGGRGMLFHLGDGLAIAYDAAAQVQVLSSGSEATQRYANETYFLTDSTWRDYLVCRELGGVHSLCLMSDGVAPFACEGGQLKSAFLDPLRRYAATHTTAQTAGALTRLLDGPEAQRCIDDDKTLLWAIMDPLD